MGRPSGSNRECSKSTNASELTRRGDRFIVRRALSFISRYDRFAGHGFIGISGEQPLEIEDASRAQARPSVVNLAIDSHRKAEIFVGDVLPVALRVVIKE